MVIFSRTLQDHVLHVRLVLQRLLENRLFVQLKKVRVMPPVSFLGFVVEKGQIKTDPAKVQAMSKWPTPITIKQLQKFLGLTTF